MYNYQQIKQQVNHIAVQHM